MCPDDPALFAIENRGYSRATGNLVLPSGQHVSVSHEEGALTLANALARNVWNLWEEKMNDALDYLMGSGAPTLAFPEIGATHEGVIRSYEKKQQQEMGTGAPKTYDNGDPMYQLVFTVETNERDPEIEADDGVRRLFAKGNMLVAIREAVKRSGHKPGADIVGGTLGVKYVKDGKATRSGFNPPKEFAAKFDPPKDVAPADGYGYDDMSEPF